MRAKKALVRCAGALAGLRAEGGAGREGAEQQRRAADGDVVGDRFAELIAPEQGDRQGVAEVGGVGDERAGEDGAELRPGQVEDAGADQVGGSGGERGRHPGQSDAAAEVGVEGDVDEVEERDRRQDQVEDPQQRPARIVSGPLGPAALGGDAGGRGDHDCGDDQDQLRALSVGVGGRQSLRKSAGARRQGSERGSVLHAAAPARSRGGRRAAARRWSYGLPLSTSLRTCW